MSIFDAIYNILGFFYMNALYCMYFILVDKLDRFSNIADSNRIWEDYLSKQVPFVVTDTVQYWRKREPLDMKKIVEVC